MISKSKSNKPLFMAILLGLSTLSTATAQAGDGEGVYVNIGLTQLSADLDSGDQEFPGITTSSLKFIAATGRAGYQLNKYVAIEGEVGFGLNSEDFGPEASAPELNLDVELEISNYYAGFVRGIFPVSENVDIFARIGYGQTKLKGNVTIDDLNNGVTSASESDSFDEVLFGGGIQFDFTSNDGVRADYTRFEDVNLLSLTYSRRF